ncbi:MAG: polyketide synthase, partial [Planctomycetes bacterium]|nr:polyketide synthase [Planctomycetota bacterium]
MDPAQLQYIECHATSTKVGDATEVSALTAALAPRLPAGKRIPIGSVKANIGHTLESAGIASLLKVILAARHGLIPPQINFRTPNPQIEWDRIPFFVPTEAKPWPEPREGQARRAAVNAFGIGGLNVHVVLDDRPTKVNSTLVNVPDAVRTDASSDLRRHTATSEPIAIVGLGCIFPKAPSADAFWELLVSGRSGLSEVPSDRWNANLYFDPHSDGFFRARTKLGGFITEYVYDWKKHKVPPKQVANANPLQFMLLDAADAALRDAGYDQRPFDRERTAVVVGTTFGGDFACHMQMGLRLPETVRLIRESLQNQGVEPDRIDRVAAEFEKELLKRMPALADETGSFTASTLASRLSKTFDLMGGAFTVDAADTSSMAALVAAMNLLRTGKCDTVLCASGQRSMDVTVYESFGLRGLLPDGPPRSAFDRQGHGAVPGEGVGVLVLKRLADAVREGDKIGAIIRGVG